MRPYITRIIALLVLVGAIAGARKLASSNKKTKPVSQANIPTAFVTPAQNKSIPINIIESGRLSARHRIELFSEVQGIMLRNSKEFKAGTRFKKGDVLVQINSDQFFANLQAQKSSFENLIGSIIPDIKLDFPDAYNKWDAYLSNYNINTPIAKLPEPSSVKEKRFLTGKNVYTSYYNIKNSEILLSKYKITAPFDGILTEALVTEGSLVRNGQKLGEFINPNDYELELAIDKELASFVQIGKQVKVQDNETQDALWMGTVTRVNGKVDATMQTIQVFVRLNGQGLKDGMYLEAHIKGKAEENAIELPRNLLVDDTKVYAVNADSSLVLKEISVVHKTRANVVIQGVEDATLILSRAIPGAYEGMKVIVKEEQL